MANLLGLILEDTGLPRLRDLGVRSGEKGARDLVLGRSVPDLVLGEKIARSCSSYPRRGGVLSTDGIGLCEVW